MHIYVYNNLYNISSVTVILMCTRDNIATSEFVCPLTAFSFDTRMHVAMHLSTNNSSVLTNVNGGFYHYILVYLDVIYSVHALSFFF